MPKNVWNRTRKDAEKLSRTAKKGETYYVILDVAQNLAPYEDAQLYSAYTVTGMHPLLGGAMFGGAMSAERLVLDYGPVYASPPKGIRGVHELPPQVAGPLPKGKEHDRDVYTDAYAKEIAAAQRAAEKAKKSREKEKVGAAKSSRWW